MSADYYGHIAGELADEGRDDPDPDDYDDRLMPPAREEPDFDAIEYAAHCETVHSGKACICPAPTPEEIDAMWAEQIKQHGDEVHGGGPCDCPPPF